MNPLEKYRSYILESDFKINVSFNYIDILNFTKIIAIDEKEAIVEINNNLIKVTGNNIRVARMLEDELLLTGNIKNINMGNK